MNPGPRIVTDNATLHGLYHDLRAGDIIRGRIRLRPGEDHLLLDLCRRGLVGVPSFISQLCSRSKTLQARILGRSMVPATAPVYSLHDLIQVVNDYGGAGVGEVVVKLDRKNGGLGVFRYRSIEEVYTQTALGQLPLPLVVQPFVDGCRDLRVIALGDYWEAYERCNPANFRSNLHCGGEPVAASLSEAQRRLCERVMKLADFPYAHIDLLVTGAGACYVSEINLRGGLRGARINPEAYRQRMAQIEEKHCEVLRAGRK